MFGPMMVTLGAVAVGAVLALVTTRGHVVLGALRTFAAIAVVTSVLVQLLPEAAQELGVAALGAFVGALVLPRFVALLGSGVARGAGLSVRSLGADLGFGGFLLHQWAEGLALGTFVGDGHGHGELVLGMAAHTIPLTAVFVAATLSARGRAPALRRTGALLVATALGFAAAGTISASAVADVLPWLSAAVAGFLCHILLHDEGLSVRRTPLAGALDLLGALCGVALPLLAAGMHRHAPHDGHDVLRERLGEAFSELVAGTAPMLLLGLVLGAALQLWSSRIPGRHLDARGSVRQGVRGIAIGARLPLCAYGVPSLAEALRRRGAGPALVAAFVVSTPELGPATVTLTLWFLGTTFVLVRIAAAVVVAFVAAMVFARVARTWPRGHDDGETHEAGRPMLAGSQPPAPAGWSTAVALFDELLLHIGPWAFVWLVAAAYVRTVIPAGSLAWLSETGGDVLVVALVAVPTYVCAASATPLAAVLLLQGISPGAVLVGLLIGPATNLATIDMLRRGYGGRVVALGLGAVLVLAMAMGGVVNLLQVPVRLPEALGDATEPGPWALGSMAVLGVMLLRQLWRWGTHPWFEILDAGSHGHGHGPEGHGHDRHEHDRHEHPGHDHDHHAHGREPTGRHRHAHDHDHIPGLPDLDHHGAAPTAARERADADA